MIAAGTGGNGMTHDLPDYARDTGPETVGDDDDAVLPAQSRSSNLAADADQHVGARIRERRVMLGLSQQQLAQMIGVTYQQAHKYERGLNRISAGRLYEIALTLRVPVAWFFEGMKTDPTAIPDLSQSQRRCLELARNFALIENERHQEALTQMARALAQAVGGPNAARAA